MKTLVIHPDDRTTDFLKPIYEGLPDIRVISEHGTITHRGMTDLIRDHDRVFILGHGCPNGLFFDGANFAMLNDGFGPLLAEKQAGLYIWCNADHYVNRHQLLGFYTGMFISEVAEAHYCGVATTQSLVNTSNWAFSAIVRRHLDNDWGMIKQEYANSSCNVTRFNRERLYIM